MSEAKEGKLLGRKKLLDPHLGITEGTKITSTIVFYTSHAPTVYSIVHWVGGILMRSRFAQENLEKTTYARDVKECQESNCDYVEPD